MSPTPATPTASAPTSARGLRTLSVGGLTRRSATTLAFAALTFALCVMKAFGREVEYELLIFTASVAGLDSVAGIVRGGVGAIGARLADRAAHRGDEEGDEAEAGEQLPPVPAYPYEPIPRELDAPLWPALDVAEIVTAPHLAVVLYRESFGGPLAKPQAFDALPREVQASWLDVAHLAAALVRGEPDALDQYLDHLGDAAGACGDLPDPTAAEEPAP